MNPDDFNLNIESVVCRCLPTTKNKSLETRSTIKVCIPNIYQKSRVNGKNCCIYANCDNQTSVCVSACMCVSERDNCKKLKGMKIDKWPLN